MHSKNPKFKTRNQRKTLRVTVRAIECQRAQYRRREAVVMVDNKNSSDRGGIETDEVLSTPEANKTNPSTGNQGVNILSAFQNHQLSLKRFISKYLNNTQDIEDVTQEAFLRAYKAEKTTEVRQPKSFLFRIAKNVAISQLRKKSRQITDYIEDQPTSDVLVNEWSTEDEVMAQQKLGIHCEAVAALPPKCRRVYLLRKVYGMSHKEIAAHLGIATSTVEKHLLKGVEACDSFIQERMSEARYQQQAERHQERASAKGPASRSCTNHKTGGQQ